MPYADSSTGCQTCDETNLDNAAWAIHQLLECQDNEINTLADALEQVAMEVGALRDEPIDDVHDVLPNVETDL